MTAPNIHPTTIIEGDVSIGDGTKIGPFAHIVGPAVIGRDCTISTGVVIGEIGEHRELSGPGGPILIGNDVTLREYAVVQRGLDPEQSTERAFFHGTTIEDHAYIMHGVHVAHDCYVGQSVTMSPFVVLGGHTVVLPGATLGIHSCTHQFSTIGACAMVGMNSTVVGDVPTAMKAVGSPARLTGMNPVGIDRAGFSRERMDDLAGQFDIFSTRPRAKRATKAGDFVQ
jgi:UDP-N-acetylglucosamine acyltransferase